MPVPARSGQRLGCAFVRAPQDLPRRTRRGPRRGRFWLVVAIIVVIVLFASLRTIATFYTDYLWFGSVHLGGVWRRLLEVKAGLFFGFAAVFAVVLWVNLAVVDRLAPRELALGPEDELVRRYQQGVAPRAVLVRTVVVGGHRPDRGVGGHRAVAELPPVHERPAVLLLGPAVPQERRVLRVPAPVPAVHRQLDLRLAGGDRRHHRDLATTSTGAYGCRGMPRASAQVKVHISVLLGVHGAGEGGRLRPGALQPGPVAQRLRAGGRLHRRPRPACRRSPCSPGSRSGGRASFSSTSVDGAGRFPSSGVGLWAFVAVVVGAIYPAIVQALKVNPAQNSLERPYIARNIDATRAALGLNHVTLSSFSASQDLTPTQVIANQPTLNNVQLWDPTQTAQTYTKLQATNLLPFNTLAVDRYLIDGNLVAHGGGRPPGERQRPALCRWVNTHLQYTHGYGMILAPSNASNQRRSRCSTSGRSRPSPRTGAAGDRPAVGLLRAQQPQRRRCRLRGGQHQASRRSTTRPPSATTPWRAPTTRAPAACSSRLSSPRRSSPSGSATSTCSSPT